MFLLFAKILCSCRNRPSSVSSREKKEKSRTGRRNCWFLWTFRDRESEQHGSQEHGAGADSIGQSMRSLKTRPLLNRRPERTLPVAIALLWQCAAMSSEFDVFVSNVLMKKEIFSLSKSEKFLHEMWIVSANVLLTRKSFFRCYTEVVDSISVYTLILKFEFVEVGCHRRQRLGNTSSHVATIGDPDHSTSFFTHVWQHNEWNGIGNCVIILSLFLE